jgi:hypothetical protein
VRRKFRNPLSGRDYLGEESCLESIERDHGEELTRMGVTARQLAYNYRNGLGLWTSHGRSVSSGRPTAWNERAGRYDRFADDAERARYRQTFLDRMRRVHGKDHLLDDPDHQRRMLASRSISGTYRFADGYERTYTGKEELAFLRFMDEALGWPGRDVWTPAPQNFRYTDPDGRERWYIPDAYVESLNLLVEVKGEMHAGYRTRDIDVERAKDGVLGTSGYSYAKVEDGDYASLLDAMARASAATSGSAP